MTPAQTQPRCGQLGSNLLLLPLLFSLLSILELSHTTIFEPETRAYLGTAFPYCEEVVFKSGL